MQSFILVSRSDCPSLEYDTVSTHVNNRSLLYHIGHSKYNQYTYWNLIGTLLEYSIRGRMLSLITEDISIRSL